MKFNATALVIYDQLQIGYNFLNLVTFTQEVGLCRSTVDKYLELFIAHGLIDKMVVPHTGGSKHDSRLTTIITKY